MPAPADAREELRRSGIPAITDDAPLFYRRPVDTRDQHGYLHVVDRLSDLIKSGGEWISTLELEDALSTFPGVTAAAVVGVPDPRWQERPRAYVVCADPIDTARAKDHLAARFPRFWVPDEIVVVESLRPIRGEVRWFSDRRAGVVFDQPLKFEELAEWIGKRLEMAALKASIKKG